MIKKVLIAEDHESINISVQKTLEELRITDIDYVYYCDDALARIKNQVYDLLITDLYFEEDHRIQEIPGGAELITAARLVQPDLKVLVFSAEGKPAAIEMLFNNLEVDGYVRKARNDSKELKQAIESIASHQRYFPWSVTQLFKQKKAYDFTEFDIAIISLMAQGVSQKEIPTHLRQKKIRPSSLSSVEKRLNHIKEALNCSSIAQLVAFCKDRGVV